MRSLEIAQHEAAHVVVALALGLNVTGADVAEDGGHTDVKVKHGHWLKDAVCDAAGLAWDRMVQKAKTSATDWGKDDWKSCKRTLKTRANVETAIKLATALLETRAGAHARVTRILLERRLTRRDIDALKRGETWRE